MSNFKIFHKKCVLFSQSLFFSCISSAALERKATSPQLYQDDWVCDSLLGAYSCSLTIDNNVNFQCQSYFLGQWLTTVFLPQNYDIQRQNSQEWVAVAYEENYYVGQIEKKSTKTVSVTFLAERAGVFQWPKKNDRYQVLPKFIFCRNLEVTNDEKNSSVYLVKNLEGIRAKFRGFTRKYFSQFS